MDLRKVVYPDLCILEMLEDLIKIKKLSNVSRQIRGWLTTSKCPFSTAAYIILKSRYKNSYKCSLCKIVANNLKHILIPDKSTTSKEVKKQLAEIVCDFHVKYRKLLVELLRLDQLDIMF